VIDSAYSCSQRFVLGLAILVLLIVAALGFVAAWNTPLQQGTGCQVQNTSSRLSENDNKDSCTIIGTVISAPLGDAWDFTENHHLFDFGVALFTLFLAFFTGFLWRATVGLLTARC
jgi:hypothetical protein